MIEALLCVALTPWLFSVVVGAGCWSIIMVRLVVDDEVPR